MTCRISNKKIAAFVLILTFSSLSVFVPAFAGSPPDPSVEGLNIVEDLAMDAGTLYPGSAAATQAIYVEEKDDNDAPVTVTSAIIDNIGKAASEDIAKVEVLASTEAMEGFDKKGEASVESFPVTIDIFNFSVAANGSAEVRIKVHVADSIATGGSLKLETSLVHDEASSIGIRKTVVDQAPETIEAGETFPIPYVVSHWDTEEGKLNPNDNPTIDTDEVLQAIAWWADDTQIPRTGGETISTDMILQLISYWADEKEITNGV